MNRIREAARRAAEALESRAFFHPPNVQGPGTLDVLRREVRCLVHRGCPDQLHATRPSIVLRAERERLYVCSDCWRVWDPADIEEYRQTARGPVLAGVADPDLQAEHVSELHFQVAIGAVERRIRADYEPASPPDEPLAPGNPHRMPLYRPGR